MKRKTDSDILCGCGDGGDCGVAGDGVMNERENKVVDMMSI